jgi:hydrogenase nickel incorporation protein HypA/HybF
MHELSITEAILEVALRHAQGRRVHAVHLLIGELSSFVDESISLFWDELSRGTPAEGAKLVFRREPGTLWCFDCEKEFSIREPSFTCPQCGGVRARPGGGRDCCVESIEVEEVVET